MARRNQQVLTHTEVLALKARSVRYEVYDGTTPGFGIRVAPSGKKSFFVLYRQGARSRRLTLGGFPTLSLANAREKARHSLADVLNGKDPGAEKQADRRAETFSELFEAYLADPRVSGKRSFKEDHRIGHRELLPALGNLRLKEIEPTHIESILRKITRRGAPIMANRTLALARSVFNFATKKRIHTGVNPCLGVTRPKEESPRERIYSEEEVRRIWEACDSRPGWVSAAVRLYFLTAARRSEVLGMRWSEINLKDAVWALPGTRTKNGRPHLVPLSPLAFEILSGLKAGAKDSPFVFPGGKSGAPVTTIQKRLDAIGASSGVEDLRLHDIRRTVATGIAKRGFPRFVIGKILNHTDGGVINVYDTHEYTDEKRKALSGWAEDLNRIVAVAPTP